MASYLGELRYDGWRTHLEGIERRIDGHRERFPDTRAPMQILVNERYGIIFFYNCGRDEKITPAEAEDVEKSLCHGIERRISLEIRPTAREFVLKANVIEMTTDEFENCTDDMWLYM